jgi:hypothetical protein
VAGEMLSIILAEMDDRCKRCYPTMVQLIGAPGGLETLLAKKEG